MTEEELTEQIWQILKRYGVKLDVRYEIAGEVINLYKQVGCVQLDDDQSLPENPYDKYCAIEKSSENQLAQSIYGRSQQDMLKAGFKKVKR